MNKNVLYLVGTSGSLEKRGFNWIRGAVSRPTCLNPFERHVIIGEPKLARDALRSDWVEDGPTARARLRYRFAVCHSDTYWDRSQVIDFIEREVVFN